MYAGEARLLAPPPRRLFLPRCFAYTLDAMDDQLADEDLMRRYRGGDAVAFDTLYYRHRGPLFRYLRRQISQAHAEELFQDIWLKIVNARHTYQPSAKFTTFLYTVAHRRLIDHYRRNSKHLVLSYDENAEREEDCADPVAAPVAARESDQPEQAADRARQVERLFALIEDLPAPQREAFLLQEESGLSVEEIAAATDVALETAKSRLRYALQKLRRGLAHE